jgi:transposase
MKKIISSVIGKKPESTEGTKSTKKIEATNKTEDMLKKKGKAKKQEISRIDQKRQRQGLRILLHKLEEARETPKLKEVMYDETVEYYIGIDIGDKKSHYCILEKGPDIAAEGSFTTTPSEFESYFKAIPRSRIALEVGTHSPWTSTLLDKLGHVVIVANPRKIGGGRKRRKNDKLDAEYLARQVKSDPKMLYPIQHRGVEARNALVLLRVRHAVVGARTKLICAARGFVKSSGHRLPRCSAESFHKVERTHVPGALRDVLEPLFAQIEALTKQIKKYDADVKRMCRKEYKETDQLQQVNGVGPLVSLAYMLTIDNPDRFAKSRDVGPYLGIVPGQYESGESRPQMRITKTGDRFMRQLLVQSAQYIIGPFGKDSDLRRHGLKIAARGGKSGKKKAAVAVARKLAVLLHRLWVTGEVYEPLRNSEPQEKAA